MVRFVGSIYFCLLVKGVYHAWCISPHQNQNLEIYTEEKTH